jgi:outer membrane protein insertion porin family
MNGLFGKAGSIIFLLTISIFLFAGKASPLMGDLPLIREIAVEGNKFIKKEAILGRLPYKKGGKFDPDKTAEAIALVYSLGYFRQIRLETEELSEKSLNLYVVVEERKLLEGISFEGNTYIKSKKIFEELELEKLETVDEEQLKRIAVSIKNLYKDKNYHFVKVDHKIVVNKDNTDKARVIFKIDEGKRAKIKRIYFKGNKFLLDRKLRTIIFTREDWILGLLDDSGKYSPDALEMDKKRIEYFYRDYGYLMAKVAKVDIEFVKDDSEITVTFHIREGDRFNIRYLAAPGDEIFEEDELMPHILLQQGKPFSQSKLVKSITNLKAQWGNVGYIYADVYPQIVPNEQTKEVDVTFHAEKGKKMFVNRINITGNKLTLDRVIRREIAIEEGDLITSKKLVESSTRVNYLGYFERGSVNWKIHKLKEDRVDLEMNVKESKTGRLNVGLSYGSDKGSTSRTLRGNAEFNKANFWGRGFDLGASVQASLRRFQKGQLTFFDPHIFDTDVSTALNLYVRQDEYDNWKNVTPAPVERTIGLTTRVGFLLPSLSRRAQISFEFGVENISNNNPKALPSVRSALQPVVDRKFQEGRNTWFGVDIGKDTRNHRVYPTHGYKILWTTRTAPPGINRGFSFLKTELDWSWYTPLIGEESLVLGLHSNAGIVDSISKKRTIPYKELFHMGGQDTVRGFLFGGVGPAWISGQPLGARKAFQFNAELLFPLVPDYNMKGHVFYDAGAGWDTPKEGISNKNFVKRDHFNLRHSVGFGINLTSPFPAKIDWGYKLDRDKASGESPHEFHISMNTAW